MHTFFHRLENALKRANEFIDVGKKLRALEILCDVLKSRKHRTWQKKHEEIMFKCLDLCVELRRNYFAKEAIYQYKLICSQAYSGSFEEIVRYYLKLSEERAEIASAKARAVTSNVGEDVDDLDDIQTPESIMLGAVSSEDTQDRTDRVVLLPWIKFCWDAYRQCLDMLRNNVRTEKLYHEIANQAFQFCIKYNRKTEFRKLCDNLHLHLDTLKKQQQQLNQSTTGQHNIINLSNAESQALHLETRLAQLDCAIKMELWQEAYKATDDIKKFNLMNLSKKPLKPQLMASYYQKLVLVFWKANCPLFHATALFRLFNLTKELRKNITKEDIQKMASRVVIATLSIPIPPTRPEIDKLVDTEENVIESHQRNLASLLGLQSSPTRGSLVADLQKMGVLQNAYEPLQQLYKWLEIDFHPLTLCSKVTQSIDFIQSCEECPELSVYVNALKDVTIVRLLKEVSQVYQSMEYKRVLELCPFVDSIRLEQMIVSAARRNDLQIRIDHLKRCFYFGSESRVSCGEVIEGPYLQSMPSEQVRQQLVTMYSTLQRARLMIDPNEARSKRNDLKRVLWNQFDATKHSEHKKILDRQNFIEKRKEELEMIGLEREKEERKLQEEREQELRRVEDDRKKREAEERERLLRTRKEAELTRQMKMDQIVKLKQQDPTLKMFEDLNDDELMRLGTEDIEARRSEQMRKELMEQQKKLRKYERTVDHFERAKRLEEIPVLEAEFEKWKELDEKLWQEQSEEQIQEAVEEHQKAVANKERLMRMQDDKEKFKKIVLEARHIIYKEKFAEWSKKVEQERVLVLARRKEQRKQQRRQKYIMAKIEAENKAKQEAENKARLEAERKRQEERAAQDEKLAKQEEMKRKREQEIEEREKQERQERLEKLERERKERQFSERPALIKPPQQTRFEEKSDWRDRAEPVDRSDVYDRVKSFSSSKHEDKPETDKYSRPFQVRRAPPPQAPKVDEEPSNWRTEKKAPVVITRDPNLSKSSVYKPRENQFNDHMEGRRRDGPPRRDFVEARDGPPRRDLGEGRDNRDNRETREGPPRRDFGEGRDNRETRDGPPRRDFSDARERREDRRPPATSFGRRGGRAGAHHSNEKRDFGDLRRDRNENQENSGDLKRGNIQRHQNESRTDEDGDGWQSARKGKH